MTSPKQVLLYRLCLESMRYYRDPCFLCQKKKKNCTREVKLARKSIQAYNNRCQGYYYRRETQLNSIEKKDQRVFKCKGELVETYWRTVVYVVNVIRLSMFANWCF